MVYYLYVFLYCKILKKRKKKKEIKEKDNVWMGKMDFLRV